MLRVGIIGAGGIMCSHAQRMEQTGEATVVSIAEPSSASVARFRESTKLDPVVYHDFREMLSREPLDCVLVGSPHTMHLEHITVALQAGLHVLTEKPMVCSVADARTVLDVARKSRGIFMISYQRHLDPRFLWIKQQIESGSLGRLTYISSVLLQEWLYVAAGTWRHDPALSGGGELNDSGTHFLDVLRWVGGPVQQVHAYADNRGTRVDINTTVNMRFASGALASLDVVGDAHGFWEDWTFSCERGTILYRNGDLRLLRLGEGAYPVEQSQLPPSTGDPDRAFVDAVLGRCEVPIPGRIGLEVIALTESIWTSVREDRPVDVPNV